jgi:hypothetical protein
MKKTLFFAAVALLLSASQASAVTYAVASNTVSPTLRVIVNVQTAVQLTLSQATGGCAITNPGAGGEDFSIDFGNVNGLGLGTPSSCIKAVDTATSTAAAFYLTDYQTTAKFSGFTATGSKVTLTHAGFTNQGTNALDLYEGATATSASSLTQVPTSGNSYNFSTGTSGTTTVRTLAVRVSNYNGTGAFPGTAGAAGADHTVVTFALTVP